MPNAQRPLRLILVAVLALIAGALLWIAVGVLRGAVGLWHDLQTLPAWLQDGLIALLALAVLGIGWLAWFVLRPRRRRPRATAAPTRAQV